MVSLSKANFTPMAAAAAAACSSSISLSSFSGVFSLSKYAHAPATLSLRHRPLRWRRWSMLSVSASVSAPAPEIRSDAGDLVASILSKVGQSDRGVLLGRDEHKAVDEIAQQLQKYCVDAPVKCPLIFGEWDVVYCSNPTSPGGGYRSAVGRLIFKTKEMIQVLEAPDIVKNRVLFSAFGFFDGEVSLKGKLKALDERWVQVIFEPPQLRIGVLELQYGGESEVKLEITYIDDKIRLGRGSKGALFVFRRSDST